MEGQESRPEAGDLLDPAFIDLLARLTLQVRRRFRGERGGERRSPRTGAGLEFASHRAYAAGDDLRHLDWSLLARHDRAFVKQYDEDTDLSVHLVLDASTSMSFGSPSKLAAAQRLAAALSHVALRGLDRVGIALIGGERPVLQGPFRGRGAMARILPTLAAARADGAMTLERGLRLHAGATRAGLTVIFSDFFESEIAGALRHHRARRESLVLVQLLAPEEVDPPREGDYTLVDSETGDRLEASLGATGRKRYLERLAAHRDGLAELARRNGFDFVSLVTDQPLDEMVLEGMMPLTFLRGGAR